MLFGCLAALLFAPLAWAQDAEPAPPARVVVWFDRDAPAEDLQAKAQRQIGGDALHLDAAVLAFPPDPWDKNDQERLGQVGKFQRDAQQRWEEFDVELGFATNLRGAIDKVEVVRDSAERDALILANVWYGASTYMAFAPQELRESAPAEPHRVPMPGVVANKGLLGVYALDPTRVYTRNEFPEAGSFGDYQSLTEALALMPKGELALGTLPGGATLVVDGVPVENPGEELELAIGHHYVHLLVDGDIAGRAEVDIRSGETARLPRAVSELDREKAERLVEEGSSDGLPEGVGEALALVGKQHKGVPLFLAARTADDRVVVVPYSGGARLEDKEPITFAIGAEIGGGLAMSPFFYYGNPDGRTMGEVVNAPVANGAFDFELGIYNVAVLAGAELLITPTEELPYGKLGTRGEEPVDGDVEYTPLYARVHGGLGLYILRPRSFRRPTLLVAGNYGWFSPGHMGPGARLTLGIPIGKQRWFRVTAHGYQGQPMPYYPDETMTFVGLRLGFQSSI